MTDKQHEEIIEELKGVKKKIGNIPDGDNEGCLLIIICFLFFGGSKVIDLLTEIVELLKGMQ